MYGFDACVIRVNDNTVTDCSTGLNVEEFDENTYDPGRGVDAQVSGNIVTLGSTLFRGLRDPRLLPGEHDAPVEQHRRRETIRTPFTC